jgi:hypothetical protein
MVRIKKCNKGKINTKRRMKQVTKRLGNEEDRKMHYREEQQKGEVTNNE